MSSTPTYAVARQAPTARLATWCGRTHLHRPGDDDRPCRIAEPLRLPSNRRQEGLGLVFFLALARGCSILYQSAANTSYDRTSRAVRQRILILSSSNGSPHFMSTQSAGRSVSRATGCRHPFPFQTMRRLPPSLQRRRICAIAGAGLGCLATLIWLTQQTRASWDTARRSSGGGKRRTRAPRYSMQSRRVM